MEIMKYGSTESVMFKMLFLTGCRISELDNMRRSMLIAGVIHWQLGKNQRGWRKEQLPDVYLKELILYHENYRVYKDKIFSMSGKSLRRRFNSHIRQNLGSKWHERIPTINKNSACKWEYRYNLKGLRKDFQTLLFKQQLDKWKDAGIALEFTSKKMRHSSTKLTAYHYLVNFDTLDISKYSNKTPARILQDSLTQRRIIDYV